MSKEAKKTRGARGEGSIHKRGDGRYEVTLPVAITDGKRVRMYAKTKTEAVALKRESIAKHAKGANLTAKKQTLRTYMEGFYEGVIVKTRAEGTRRSYRQNMDNHILPSLGDIDLEKLSVADVRAFMNSLSEKNLSPESIRIIRAALHATLNMAVREDLLIKNVASKVQPPSKSKKHLEFIKIEEAKKIVAVASNHRWGLPIKVALFTGLQKGELLGLKWDCVNLETGVVKVEKQLQRVKAGEETKLTLVRLKTSKSVRVIQLPEKLVAELKTHRADQTMTASQLESSWKGDGFVFTSEIGTPIEPRNFNKALNDVLKIAEVPHYRVHDLRHGAASLMLNEGAELKLIQEVLGHSQFSLTADLYSHVMMEKKQEIASKLNNLL